MKNTISALFLLAVGLGISFVTLAIEFIIVLMMKNKK